MNKSGLKKIGVLLLWGIGVIYLLFLILPFILSPILNGYSGEIAKMVEASSGFKVKFEKMQLVTTPKLTAGVKIAKTELFLPSNEKFLQADNFQVKLSLLPMLLRRIEVDIVSADSLNLDLKVQKGGKFLIENYIPEAKPQEVKPAEKPFLKLSNHLPDIKINSHNINFIDMTTGKKYSLEGADTKITDFILDKKVKISGTGKVVLDGQEQFNYNVKIFNKIMPNVQLNDLVFNPQPVEKQPQEINVNVIDIFKALYNNRLSANLNSDIKTYGDINDVRLDGLINVDKLHLAVNNKDLPDSFISMNLKGNKIVLDSDFYTAQNEITHVKGRFKTGKNPDIDMSFKSNAGFKSIFEIANSVAKSFGISDLQTLSANGAIDADFNIKSNMKKIESSGYLKIPNANINYGLYNVSINNIISDISFDNNLVNIKKTGFNILGHPLKIYGTIKQDATADLSLVANNLSLKSILLSLGQVSVLKENAFKSGTLTMNATLKGRLDNPSPNVNISIDNLNLKNIPTASVVVMQNSTVKLYSEKKAFKGSATANNFKVINPAAAVSVPSASAVINPKEIIINPTNVSIDKIKISVSGKIKDYLTNKVILDINTGGQIQSSLTGEVKPISQKLNLNYSIPSVCTIPIPGFANSKLQAKGSVAITGAMANPYLKGTFIVPNILIPDMLVSMSDMVINLNGPIARGNGSVKKVTSGGIIANNLSADFALNGNMFYLTNIKGDAYSGKVNGKLAYNIVNGKTAVDFHGSGMNATKAILSAAGIKNALSGTLGFDTKVTLQGILYEDMVRSLKGNFSFNITDGALGQFGKLENFLNAQNILANAVMRSALSYITSLSTIKDTANFKYIKGNMTFANGWANISSITTSGPTMSYYVKGRYNILNGTTNVIVLGRLSSDVVALLGPIGDLSVDKLTSYIPRFGALTAVIIKSMTTNPNEENVANIPPLSSGDKVYKDFKVVFNGGIESKSSVKSFKWLSNVDTSVFDMKFGVKDIKKQFNEAKKSTISGVKQQYTDVKNSAINEVKGTVNETKKQILDTKEELKNLLKF